MSNTTSPEPAAVSPQLPKEVFSVEEFINAFGLSRGYVYDDLLGTGQLVARKAGKRTLIFRADIEAWRLSLPVYSTETKTRTNIDKGGAKKRGDPVVTA